MIVGVQFAGEFLDVNTATCIVEIRAPMILINFKRPSKKSLMITVQQMVMALLSLASLNRP